MTTNDKRLIKEAHNIRYWNWRDVYLLTEKADSEETKERLRNISSLLYDFNIYGRD